MCWRTRATCVQVVEGPSRVWDKELCEGQGLDRQRQAGDKAAAKAQWPQVMAGGGLVGRGGGQAVAKAQWPQVMAGGGGVHLGQVLAGAGPGGLALLGRPLLMIDEVVRAICH